MRLRVEDVRFRYGATEILKGITLTSLAPGAVTALIGPNAAGKTTLFKCMAGILKGSGGVYLDGQDLRQWSRQEITRHLTYLPQDSSAGAVLTVFEALLLARQHAVSWRVGEADLRTVAETLELLEMTDLATRHLNELSGGQRQLVAIAQALVRSPTVLLMDEPTNSLDLQHQLEVLELVRAITVERGITTLIALHDLNLAARYADHVVVLSGGTVYAAGPAAAILTPRMLRDVYGVQAAVEVDTQGIPNVTPICSVRSTRRVPVAT
jgi:iron complex transport system ATP-binding protein